MKNEALVELFNEGIYDTKLAMDLSQNGVITVCRNGKAIEVMREEGE
ncbi:MAG: hypothetical protein ACK5L6_06120 [Anaerorhabdus sp.]